MNTLPLEIIYKHIYVYIPAYNLNPNILMNKYYEIKTFSIIQKIVFSKKIKQEIKNEMKNFHFLFENEYIYENPNLFVSIHYKKKIKYTIIYS
jgi:hypothetical protein